MATVQGKAYWASITRPNTTFDPVYQIDLAVDDEIIAYKAVSGSTITVPIGGRGIGNSTIVSHATNSVVDYYSINGIPLTEINTVHQLNDVIEVENVFFRKLNQESFNFINSLKLLLGKKIRIKANYNE